MKQALNEMVAQTIVAPSDSDWIVRFVMHSGEVVAKRVSPSSLTMEKAISRATLALGVASRSVSSVDAVRFSDTRRIIVPR